MNARQLFDLVLSYWPETVQISDRRPILERHWFPEIAEITRQAEESLDLDAMPWENLGLGALHGAGMEWAEQLYQTGARTMRPANEFDADLDLFRGEILGLNGGADFYGKNPEELRAEFRRSLQVFLEVCAEKGIEPRRHFSGKFNLRISPDLHEKLAIFAQAQGKSINTLAQEALRDCVAS